MMNAALRKFEIQEPITEDDDIETINRKLEVFSGRDGKDIGISDLLEEDGLQELRFIEFVRVEESAAGLVAKFTSTFLMASMMNMNSPKTPNPGSILRANMNAACF